MGTVKHFFDEETQHLDFDYLNFCSACPFMFRLLKISGEAGMTDGNENLRIFFNSS